MSVLGKGLSSVVSQGGIVNGVADIFNESLNMISRMAVFNEVLGIGLTALNINSGGAVARFIKENSFLKGLDSLGLNLFSQISYYTKLAKEGNFLDVVAAVTSGANQLLYTPQMYLFSFGTRIGMRVLAPILQNIPGLGEIMKVLGKVDTGVGVLDTAFEEGIKESLPGFFLKDAGTMGEIIQELFDETPDGNFKAGIELLNNVVMGATSISQNGTRIESGAQQRQARRDVRQAIDFINGGLRTVKLSYSHNGLISVNQAEDMRGLFANLNNSIEFETTSDIQTAARDLLALVGGCMSLETAYTQALEADNVARQNGDIVTAVNNLNLDLRNVTSVGAQVRALETARQAVEGKVATRIELINSALQYTQYDVMSGYTFDYNRDNRKVSLIENGSDIVATVDAINELSAANALSTMMGQAYAVADARTRTTDTEKLREQFSNNPTIEYNENTNTFSLNGERLETLVNRNINIINATEAIKSAEYSSAIDSLNIVYGNGSFVLNNNGTVTIRNSNGNYNVHGNIVTIPQENLGVVFDLITRFGSTQTLDLRCLSSSYISQAVRAESYREIIATIGLQNAMNVFGINIENIFVNTGENGSSFIAAQITVNGVTTDVTNIQLTNSDIANIARSSNTDLLERLIDADRANIEADLITELKGQNAIRDIISDFEGTGIEAEGYKNLRERLITSIDTLGRATYGSELYNNAKQQLIETLNQMAKLNNITNRGRNEEKIGAIAQTILSEGNIASYDEYRKVKEQVDSIDKQLSLESDSTKILDLEAQRRDLLQKNGVDASVSDRFEIQKQRYMNGHAKEFLNRFSITENIFRNDSVYQQLQKYDFSGEYEDFAGNKVSLVMNDMDVAVFAESLKNRLRWSSVTDGRIESLIRDLNQEYTAGIETGMAKKLFDTTGFTTYESLIPRLKILQEIVQSGKLGSINSKYESAVKRVNDFLKNQGMKFNKQGRVFNEDGKILNINSVDEFMNQIRSENLSDEQIAMIMRVFAQECVRGSNVFNNAEKDKGATESYALRASQTEMVSAFLRGENIALGMGGGKTVSYCADAIIHRMILGQNANIEILVGNDDPANFVNESSEARKILEFAGLKTQNLNDFKAEGQSTDVSALREAYSDANTVMVVTPTTKAHMLNEAVSMGVSGMELTDILNSVNRVLADEIHLWALTTTAAVIGGNNNPPSSQLINDMLNLADMVDAASIIEQLENCKNDGAPRTAWEIKVKIGGNDTLIKFFNEYSDANAFMAEHNNAGTQAIAVIGETSSKTNIKMSDSLRNSLSNKIDTGNLSSVLRGLFANTDKGGMAISKIDGKVKPMGDAIQENMVIGDIYLQMGFALRCALNGSVGKAISMNERKKIKEFISNSTQTSDTSMQTSLAALYAGSSAKIVGGSGTVSGLEQLIIGRSGASIVRNITGEMVNQKDFAVSTDSTNDVVKTILNSVLNGGTYDNALFLAKTDANVVNITNDILSRSKELIDNGFEIYVFAGQQQGRINKDGNIESVDEELTKIAKDSSRKRIIIANEFGMTGIDYQGKFELGQWDAHLMTNADLAQSIKRTGRPGGETGRWETNRTLVFNNESFQSQITEFSANSELLRAARELWNGTRAQDMAGSGYLANSKALEIMDALESADWDIKKLLDTKKYTQGDIVEFVSNIQTLYAVDGSVRFALNDSMRDKMLLSVLRELKQMTTGEERELVSQILNEALQKGSSSADFEYKTDSGSQSASEVISSSFDRVYQEAMSRLSNLKSLSGAAGLLLNAHLNELQIVNDNYRHIDAIKSKGLSDTFDMTEFMGVIKSFEDYILPVRSDNAKQKATTAEQLITTNTTQENLRQELIDTLENDTSLGHINAEGNIELTDRGRTYLELANRRLTIDAGDDDYDKFVAWLCSLLGISFGKNVDVNSVAFTKILATSLDNKGFNNVSTLGQIFDTFNQNGLIGRISYDQLKHIYNVQKDSMLQKTLKEYNILLPKDYEKTVALARTYKNILEQDGDINSEMYKYVGNIAETYDTIIFDVQSLYQMQIKVKNIKSIKDLNLVKVNMSRIKRKLKNEAKVLKERIDITITNLLDDIPQLQEQLKESKYYNQKVETIETGNKIADIERDIKARMAMTGYLNSDTDKAIDNLIWLQANKPEFLKGFKTSDVAGLEQFTSLISLANTAENFNLALDKETFDAIRKGTKSILSVYAPNTDVERALSGNVMIDQIERIISDNNIDIKYAMALMLPKENDIEKLVNRYNILKDSEYGKYARVKDLRKEGNFTEGAISDEYKQELLSRMPFGEVSNTQIRKLGAGIAVSKAKEIVKELGGSEQAQEFVKGLSLGVLSDKDFMKEFITLIDKASRQARNISASDIYNNKELAGKINAIYQNNLTGNREAKLDELIENEYPTKTEIEKAVENNIGKITAKVNEATEGEYTQEAVEGMLLENCAVQALKGITVVVPMIGMVEGLTKMAVEMVSGESEYEGTDSLKAAG